MAVIKIQAECLIGKIAKKMNLEEFLSAKMEINEELKVLSETLRDYMEIYGVVIRSIEIEEIKVPQSLMEKYKETFSTIDLTEEISRIEYESKKENEKRENAIDEYVKLFKEE